MRYQPGRLALWFVAVPVRVGFRFRGSPGSEVHELLSRYMMSMQVAACLLQKAAEIRGTAETEKMAAAFAIRGTEAINTERRVSAQPRCPAALMPCVMAEGTSDVAVEPR